MTNPSGYVSIDENVQDILEKFKKTESNNLPVIDGGKYIGFISKARLLEEYRKLFVEQSEELL